MHPEEVPGSTAGQVCSGRVGFLTHPTLVGVFPTTVSNAMRSAIGEADPEFPVPTQLEGEGGEGTLILRRDGYFSLVLGGPRGPRRGCCHSEDGCDADVASADGRSLCARGSWKCGTYNRVGLPTGDVLLTVSECSGTAAEALRGSLKRVKQLKAYVGALDTESDVRRATLVKDFDFLHLKRASGKNELIEGQKSGKAAK